LRILFLSHYFPPEVNAPASRTFEHCREWVRLGHDVTVVSCVPNHPMGRIYPNYKNRLYHCEMVEGIRVIRLLTYVTPNSRFLRRSLNYFFYMVIAICSAPFLPKADVAISTSPQFFNGLAGYFVSRLKRVPWILEIRDLWPESIVAVGAIENRWVIRILEGIESWAYKKADCIISLTDTFKPHIVAKGGEPAKIDVIKNGVNTTLFQKQAVDPDIAKRFGLADKFVAAYIGTHGMAHGLEVILDAAERLIDEPRIAFVLVGDGAEKKKLIKERDARGLHNVIMLDQQPKDMMPAIWALSDVSLILLRKLDLFTTVIPSKMFEALATETPIILGVEGESRDIVEQSGCGLCIEPENAVALAEAVRDLSNDA
jgi:glycosyltransferase involved in cell wall biosynthesis